MPRLALALAALPHAAAFALSSPAVLKSPLDGRPSRARPLFVQEQGYAQDLPTGWNAAYAEDGALYYVNEQTGESQWEAPLAQSYGAALAQSYGAALWRLVPFAGVYDEYVLGAGEQQVLGRFDMVAQSPYVSRRQCVVQVSADGVATMTTTGKPATVCRRWGSEWYWFRRDTGRRYRTPLTQTEPHILVDGEQISLDCHNPEAAIYTVACCHQEAGGAGAGGGGGVEYSDDGCWMWNGVEWVPTA